MPKPGKSTKRKVAMANSLQAIAQLNADMPIDDVINAMLSTSAYNAFTLNPLIQNKRTKVIQTLPQDYDQDEIASFLRDPINSEQPLRATGQALEVSAYPYFKIRKSYQDMLTYSWFNAPTDADDKKEIASVMREWRLVDKLCRELQVDRQAHKIAGQALQNGKVYYYPRISVDKSHNKINYAFMQQLPEDWTKIVGFNNLTGYTVAFNMTYFFQPGTVYSQFGDLFEPYIKDLNKVTTLDSKGRKAISLDAYAQVSQQKVFSGTYEPPYNQNGKWYYWVTLNPVIYTFEIDDTDTNVVPPFTGLMLAMAQVAQYESLQLSLVTNPLVACLTGEIPYRKDEGLRPDDGTRLSDGQRRMFEALWYNMLAANNTAGIGVYFAPVEQLKLQTLSEAPSATKVAANGYSYAILKAGLSALIPSTDDTRAGAAQLSAKLESRFPAPIYGQFKRMLENLYSGLNLKCDWSFTMFGDIYSRDDELRAAKEGMTLGILSDTLRYLALRGMTLSEDYSVSVAVSKSGIMDMRLPLVSSYSAKQDSSGLPPEGGRPSLKDKGEDVTSDGAEGDMDSRGEA